MISVITPCKNIVSEGRENFFRKMMKSLSEQTYQDFEHIIVDSDSQDGTIELLQEYVKLGRINKLISEKDNNLHEALNKGMKHAKGEFIHIMNSDDYFATKFFFEKSLNALKKHKVDFTHADRIIIKRNGGASSIKKGDERTAFFRMPFRWQTMIIKKEVYDEIGEFDEKYEIASDYKAMMKMLLEGKKGHYFPEIFIHSLDGGITADRQKCINEVTNVLYECYGSKYNLTIEDCKNIYLRKISQELFSKLNLNIRNKKIMDSLTYCYKEIQPIEEGKKISEGLFQIDLPDLGPPIRGKVRDNWIIERGNSKFRLIVTTDRQSLYAKPICTISGKGQISSLISNYWFEKTQDIIPNHLISALHPNIILARHAKKTIPIEVVLRRYMAKSTSPTSIYHNYIRKGRRKIYGIEFPDGLKANQELPKTILTPTTKARNGKDEELTDFEANEIVDSKIGKGIWDKIKKVSHEIFEMARKDCLNKGLILVDTKLEFGIDEEGNLMLIDEILTPECSRFWLAKTYNEKIKNGENPDLNKEILSNWFSKKGFEGKGEIPKVDNSITLELMKIYSTQYKMITEEDLPIPTSDVKIIKEVVSNFMSNFDELVELKNK